MDRKDRSTGLVNLITQKYFTYILSSTVQATLMTAHKDAVTAYVIGIIVAIKRHCNAPLEVGSFVFG